MITATEKEYLRKIAAFDAAVADWTKPQRFRDLARLSASEARIALENWKAA